MLLDPCNCSSFLVLYIHLAIDPPSFVYAVNSNSLLYFFPLVRFDHLNIILIINSFLVSWFKFFPILFEAPVDGETFHHDNSMNSDIASEAYHISIGSFQVSYFLYFFLTVHQFSFAFFNQFLFFAGSTQLSSTH